MHAPSARPPRVALRRAADPLDALLQRLGIARPRRGGFALAAGGARPLSPRIRRAQDYVEAHLGESLRLDDLAAAAGLSRYHFARVFREEVGVPPWTFVRHARARRAKALLRAGRSPAEAAHEAGFADQSHLTRTLRALDGRTPAAFRRHAANRPERGADRPPAGGSKNVQDR